MDGDYNMPYGTKAKEIRDLLLELRNQEKSKTKQARLVDEPEEKQSKTSTIFDSSTDPFEMCNPNIITKTTIDMNKLRKMRK